MKKDKWGEKNKYVGAFKITLKMRCKSSTFNFDKAYDHVDLGFLKLF